MKEYDHKKIEKKWQEKWAKDGTYNSKEDSKKPKSYVLDMFPYPSGEGLHVGHPKGYIATDVYSRFKRMTGHNVLHPMGWDAFGLPAENYAIKNKVHPRVAVEKNIARYKEQLQNIGLDYDWSREINTTDPEYYKWTQWIFLKLHEKGLAYQSDEPINWCPSCQTGLANEDLESGRCERCGSEVERRPMRQWVLRITDYADRLLESLGSLSKWPEHIKEMQRNWISKSEGVLIKFEIRNPKSETNSKSEISNSKQEIEVFTTRPDTIFGATYMVLAPEHPIISKLKSQITNWEEVLKYIDAAGKKSEIDRMAEGREKTGVELAGVNVINPATEQGIPVWVADYVLSSYGTGAIMAVPAHDERDFEFAKKYELPIVKVIEGEVPHSEHGVLVNSGKFCGLASITASQKITEKFGKKKINYRLQDWVFSRQRYWGEPIPIIHCEKCGVVPVPEEDLPVKLPEVKHYEPTGTGESPLANIPEWVNVDCPKCRGPAKRETNTMPQWAGSSWYWLRFMDPKNDKALVSTEKEKMWGPVDVYVGGDHAVRHLIYARFWHKFLYDIDVVSTEEPFSRLEYLGFILAEDGRKMSKRWGNVINPDDIVERLGADALRVYEMFMGPFENSIAWSTDSIVGARRFIERAVGLSLKVSDEEVADIERELHETIKKVGNDIENFKFNTAVSQMMIFINKAEKSKGIGESQFKIFLKLLAPFAPHITEEIWESMGNKSSIHLESWPEYDESKLAKDETTIAVQINGKVRAEIKVPTEIDKEELEKKVFSLSVVSRWIEGRTIEKIVHVPGKLLNIVVK